MAWMVNAPGRASKTHMKIPKQAKGLLPFVSSARHKCIVRGSTHCKMKSKLAHMYPATSVVLINTPELHNKNWETSGRPRPPHNVQWPFENCVSVTPALMIPVDDCPPVTTCPASSTSSEPLL